MNDDMRRLCEAVDKAPDLPLRVSSLLSEADCEAIVRAVLTELRAVSEAAMDRADDSLDEGFTAYSTRARFEAIIDAVLEG